MARIRTIKPDFWTDEKVVELSFPARLLFIGLWNFVDDEGRIQFSPKKLKMLIFPADSIEISELLGEIRRENLITIYEIEGVQYLQVNNFGKHQKVDKRSPSKLPAMDGTFSNPAEFPRVPPTEGKGMEREEEKDSTTAPPAQAHEDDHEPLPEIPEKLCHLVNYFTRKGFRREQVQTAKLVPIFKDWIARRISFAFIEEACAIAESKNPRIGTAAFYVPFVEELIVTSSQPRASPSQRQSQNRKFDPVAYVNRERKPNGHVGITLEGQGYPVERGD